jgi:flagellar basal-body rod protein FlgG
MAFRIASWHRHCNKIVKKRIIKDERRNKALASGIYEAIRGATLKEKQLDIITNNLANTNTAGFKKDVLTFDEVLQAQLSTDLSPGSLNYTGNQLDVALGDKGFFKIQTERGIRYTRDGRFLLDAEGMLAVQSGDRVLSDNGSIQIKGREITITTSGDIIADGKRMGTLSIVDFTHPHFLKKEGDGLYAYDDPNGEGRIVESNPTSVQQRYLEASNVNPVEEMTKMIEALRAYESFTKVIQTFDEANAKLINEVGKL